MTLHQFSSNHRNEGLRSTEVLVADGGTAFPEFTPERNLKSRVPILAWFLRTLHDYDPQPCTCEIARDKPNKSLSWRMSDSLAKTCRPLTHKKQTKKNIPEPSFECWQVEATSVTLINAN